MITDAEAEPSGPIVPTARGADTEGPAAGWRIAGALVQPGEPTGTILRFVIEVLTPMPLPLLASVIVHWRELAAPLRALMEAVKIGAMAAKLAVTETGAFMVTVAGDGVPVRPPENEASL